MRSRRQAGFLKAPLAVVASCAFLLAQKPTPPAVEEKLPREPPTQPIPFSHKTHATQRIKCRDCHTVPNPGFESGLPKEVVCMGCHVTIKKDSPFIQKLAEFARSKTPVPWARVYSVPDYVWFSHAVHVKEAKLECEMCHGPIATREAVFKEKSTNMASCVTCHAKLGASNGCDTCHSRSMRRVWRDT